MTLEVKKEYLKALSMRYKNATKKEKGVILDEYCKTTGLSRKHVIRRLGRPLDHSPKKPGPKPEFTGQVVVHLLRLWKVMKMCSVNMKQALPVWLRYDETPGLDDKMRSLLVKMSPSTIDRLLRPYRKSKGLISTEPAAFIKSKIPIELLTSKVFTPGVIEADTVAHCGNSLVGIFANTLTMTDLYSGWTENHASLTKKSISIVLGIRSIRARMPFRIKKFACDNGSEFLNNDIIRYFENRGEGIVKIVRRRPYKKNDNAHVEQKNDTHVRKLFGYSRIDHEELVKLMNQIYSSYWNPLLNYFYPTLKLKKKIRIGGRVKKIYDTPQTPYQRLLESGCLTEDQLDKLRTNYSLLNPFELEKNIEIQLKLFHRLVRRSQGLPENGLEEIKAVS